jgi:hypothetical protein
LGERLVIRIECEVTDATEEDEASLVVQVMVAEETEVEDATLVMTGGVVSAIEITTASEAEAEMFPAASRAHA